jgi:hypothetical protein
MGKHQNKPLKFEGRGAAGGLGRLKSAVLRMGSRLVLLFALYFLWMGSIPAFFIHREGLPMTAFLRIGKIYAGGFTSCFSRIHTVAGFVGGLGMVFCLRPSPCFKLL